MGTGGVAVKKHHSPVDDRNRDEDPGARDDVSNHLTIHVIFFIGWVLTKFRQNLDDIERTNLGPCNEAKAGTDDRYVWGRRSGKLAFGRGRNHVDNFPTWL